MVIQLLPMLTEPIYLVDEMIKMVHAIFSSVLMQVMSQVWLFVYRHFLELVGECNCCCCCILHRTFLVCCVNIKITNLAV